MKILFATILCFLSPQVFCQIATPMQKIEKPHIPICSRVETNAAIDSVLWQRNLNISLFSDSLQKALPAGRYEVLFSYVVDRDGNYVFYKIMKDPGNGLGDYVKNKMQTFPYRWSPATQDGRPVKSYHRQVVIFKK